GFETIIAHDGAHAVKVALSANHVDVLVTDLAAHVAKGPARVSGSSTTDKSWPAVTMRFAIGIAFGRMRSRPIRSGNRAARIREMMARTRKIVLPGQEVTRYSGHMGDTLPP